MNIVELQSIFEYELKRKLAQRSRSQQEELRKLISAFKFFDYYSSFILDKKQWINGVLRTGLCGFNISDLSAVFERYDPNKTGYINYINFSNHVYGKEELMPIAANFKNEIFNNGNNVVNNKSINNEFKTPVLYEKNIDNNDTKQAQLSHYNNSESALNDFNLNKTSTNISNNRINDNSINYDNNYKQKNYHMTKSQSQKIIEKKEDISDLNKNINTINFNKDKIQNNSNNNNINTDINNNSENKNYFQKLINLFQSKININNGITYYTFARELKSREDKNTHSIGIETLLSIIQQMNLNISRDDLINLFSILDYTQTNRVSSDEILRLIKGEINNERKILIVNKFSLMDKEKSGKIPISLVKQLYNSKFHPDAFLGKKSQNEVYEEFLYTFDIFCELNGLKDQISFREFIDYYTPISSSILNDNYFYDIIYGVWNIEESMNNISSPINNINNNDINNEINKINDHQNYNNIEENNIKINNNYNNYKLTEIRDISKSQAIPNSQQMGSYNQFRNENNENSNVRRQRMTPYYNPISSPEGKGLKMFRRLRFDPITNEYIMSPVQEKNNNINMNNNAYNNININQNLGYENNNKINLLRDLLAQRGQKSIFIIQRMLYIYDRNKTGEIPFDKLCDIFEIYNINITRQEIFEFFNLLDQEHKGIIRYNDLIKVLINNISNNRQFLIQKLFEDLSKGNSYVLINDIKQNFNPIKHPDVINKMKNKEEVALDFYDSVEIFNEYNSNLNNMNIKNGIMSYDDFCNFFKEISMSIKDDAFFEYLISNCWSINNYANNNNYGYGNDNVRIRAAQQIINNQ